MSARATTLRQKGFYIYYTLQTYDAVTRQSLVSDIINVYILYNIKCGSRAAGYRVGYYK